jgi:hypothetical protein
MSVEFREKDVKIAILGSKLRIASILQFTFLLSTVFLLYQIYRCVSKVIIDHGSTSNKTIFILLK